MLREGWETKSHLFVGCWQMSVGPAPLVSPTVCMIVSSQVQPHCLPQPDNSCPGQENLPTPLQQALDNSSVASSSYIVKTVFTSSLAGFSYSPCFTSLSSPTCPPWLYLNMLKLSGFQDSSQTSHPPWRCWRLLMEVGASHAEFTEHSHCVYLTLLSLQRVTQSSPAPPTPPHSFSSPSASFDSLLQCIVVKQYAFITS